VFLDAAFELTGYGFKIFPLLPGQKTPAISTKKGGKGCLDATDDEEIISGWAKRFPKANIGIHCGEASGIVVIDLDPRNGSDETVAELAKRRQTFLPTVAVRTASGGTHLYYAYEGSLKNSKSVLGAGLDVKTNRGYVVAPPSKLANGGNYVWINRPVDDRFTRLPHWVVQALRPKPQAIVAYDESRAPKDVRKLADFVSKSSEGSRNNTLYWAAWRLKESGQLSASNKSALIDAAVATGVDRIAAEKTVESAQKSSLVSGKS
jgi:putative DNA primase/helicase